MSKIILMRGIQGSGKSLESYMIQERNPNYVRVCRDEIRMQLFGKYTGVDEVLVSEVETAMVRAALRLGQTVIIDAMHLRQAYINRWQRLGYPVEIVEMQLMLDELLKRNASRPEIKQVPESVIRKNHAKYTNKDGSLKKVKLEPEKYMSSEFPKYETFRDHSNPEAFIFDLDGTLAHNDGHRSFYDYTKVYDDKVHDEVAEAARNLDGVHHIIIVTGRPAEAIPDSVRWLDRHGIPFDAIYSRQDGDQRPDSLVKYEILRDDIAPNYDVLGVFDDRPSVCEMWRNVGIPTFQVGDPEVRF